MQTAFVTFLLAALAHQAFAVLFITSPTASAAGQGGQVLTINWMDNGTAPLLATIGPCEVGLYAGNMQQQTELQVIAPSVDVSKQNSQDFTINASLGPNSNAYFIRFTSLSFKDPANPQFPYEAFSAKFSLSGMSGQFSPSVQAQVNGLTSASAAASTLAASTPAASSAASNTAHISTTTIPPTSNSATASSSSSAPKSTQSNNAALTMRGNAGVLSAVGVVVGLVGLTL